ncbi:DUF732 domain-containing protein [Streptomyces sp. TLI_171]|uniref:DUF732 domain-containing protein n=1 Tax=Streptomyces sp. TLI_171 TaxID=1938859 RepID=UPI000C62A25D|nr:DUF732 domain-containing protein [Streptomyces sp. TLI_171]RKE19054.1 hypothetical protein BX266_2355 [Streptomyces sp. TLI_171]
MRLRLIAAAGFTAVALLTLTACNDDGSDTAAGSSAAGSQSAAPAPATSSAAPANSASASSAASSTAPAAGGSVPSPNAAQTAGLLAGLKAINPALGTDQAKAVSAARNVCQEIKAGKDMATVTSNAAQRFSGGSVNLTPDDGIAIVAAIKVSFCM